MNRTFAVKVPGTLGRMSPEALSELIETIAHDLVAAGKAGTLTDDLIPETAKFAVMRPKDRAHGDWASNAAMQLAKKAGMKPRDLAELFAERLTAADGISTVEVAGPGFINITLDSASAAAVVDKVLADGAGYGKNAHLGGKTLNLEFVSANPTGPIHIGGTRWAASATRWPACWRPTAPRLCANTTSTITASRSTVSQSPWSQPRTARRRPLTDTRASTSTRSPTA